jgi:hypothetical protein
MEQEGIYGIVKNCIPGMQGMQKFIGGQCR